MTMSPPTDTRDFQPAALSDLRAHYEAVVLDTLALLWRRKWLVMALPLLAMTLAFAVVAVLAPRYTGEAVIQLNFNRPPPQDEKGVTQPIASLDASVLVDNAARLVRARATADAVVRRLELDRDPAFARPSRISRLLWGIWSYLYPGWQHPTAHDLATNELMRQVKVTNEPRSYLITVGISARTPERAALLANSLATEYLRAQLSQHLETLRAGLERELADVSAVYGELHPAYLKARAKLDVVVARIKTLGNDATIADDASAVTGQVLLPADKKLPPAGPNLAFVLALTAVVSLVLAVWLALWLGDSVVRPRDDEAHVGRSS